MSDWEVPFPIVFNLYKHHAGFLRERIAEAVASGPKGLPTLARELVVVGAKLMDLYFGQRSPREIGDEVLDSLRAAGRDHAPAFRAWVEANKGYRVIQFPADASQWVLRLGDEAGRFVHIHPARYSPLTIRVRATVLTTAVMSLAHARIHNDDPLRRAVANAVRKEYLGLSPIGHEPSAEEGIGAVIELLR